MAFITRLKSFITSQDDEMFAERTLYRLTHLTLTWKGGWCVKADPDVVCLSVWVNG